MVTTIRFQYDELMTQVSLEIREKITIPLERLRESLSEIQFEGFLSSIEESLTISNPAYQKAMRFARGRRFSKIPREIKYFKIRNPKTTPSLEIPVGFLEPLVTTLRESGLVIQVDNLLIENPYGFSSKLSLYPYQKVAVEACLQRHRGVLVAPCGSGKTVMGVELIHRRAQVTLIIVHTLDLLHQWKDQIANFLGLEAGVVGDGQENLQSEIIIATVQTLIRRPSLMMRLNEKIGTILVDECHHVPASTFQKVIASFRPTYMYGLSATPNREDGLTKAMHLFLGPLLHSVTHGDLQRENRILKPRLKVVETDFFFPFDHEEPESFSKMMEKLVSDSARNQLICSWLMRFKASKNLILSQRISHCQVLIQMVQEALPYAQCEILTGSTDKKTRQAIIEKARAGQVTYLFATQLADEGLDIRCLENLWLVTPARNIGRIEQRVGRIMREFESKEQAYVFDFVDLQTKVLFAQYRTRLNKVYKRLLSI